MRRKEVAEAAKERLKERLHTIFDGWHSGGNHPDRAFTIDLAVAAAWQAVDESFAAAFGPRRRGEAVFRYARAVGSAAENSIAEVAAATRSRILSVRCLGARDVGGEDVYYIVARCGSYFNAHRFRRALLDLGGGTVRDWQYYAS